MDPISVARYGLRAAEMRFTASAERVAANDQSLDLGGEVVEQLQAKQAFAANLGAIRVADEMWRALMDIQAERR